MMVSPPRAPELATAAILGIGTDLFEVERMEKEIEESGGRFQDSVFTPGEIAYCQSKRYPARHFAVRFAAKEALFKALGGAAPHDFWHEVEVEAKDAGAPVLRLHGRVREVADGLGVKNVLVSLSHTSGLAAATVVLQG